MQQEDIYKKLTEIFREVLDVHDLVLTPKLSAAGVPEWDSFNHIHLVVAVEAHFKIKFQTAELESIQNVGHLVELIQAKTGAQGR